MIDITKIIETNKEYVKQHPELPKAGLTSHPTKKLGIVTCMDTRLVGMLEEALGFNRGEIIVIKTAGNSVTQPIDNIVQSLLVATYGMEIEDVLIIGHENCGMIDFSATTFMESMKAKGISEDAIRMIEPGLIDWMDRFHISEDNVIYTVNFLRHHPLFPKGMGFIISSLVLQNIILIPALIAISVSGFKLYKSIVKNRERENIKVEILRHTIFSLIMLFLLCIAALIETFISTNILKNFIKYF